MAAGGDFRDWRPSYSLAPTDVVPIVRERVDKNTGEVLRSVDAAVWDFHPAFMRDSNRPDFNARIEAVTGNGLWKGAFASSRAIVPMRGYYEWTGDAGHKQPHFLHSRDGALLAAAGIYTVRRIDEGWQVSSAIITRPARDASGEVHDRMPVFISHRADRVLGGREEPPPVIHRKVCTLNGIPSGFAGIRRREGR